MRREEKRDKSVERDDHQFDVQGNQSGSEEEKKRKEKRQEGQCARGRGKAAAQGREGEEGSSRGPRPAELNAQQRRCAQVRHACTRELENTRKRYRSEQEKP